MVEDVVQKNSFAPSFSPSADNEGGFLPASTLLIFFKNSPYCESMSDNVISQYSLVTSSPGSISLLLKEYHYCSP